MAGWEVEGRVEAPIDPKPARFFRENRIQSLNKHARLVQNMNFSKTRTFEVSPARKAKPPGSVER